MRRPTGPDLPADRGTRAGPRRLPRSAALDRRRGVLRLRCRRCPPSPASLVRSHSVQAQANDPGSTLAFYRDALRVRAQLHAVERLDWVETRNPEVLRFIRPGSWLSITNFGRAPIPLTAGEVAIVSAPLIGDQLPQDATAWIVQARARPATG